MLQTYMQMEFERVDLTKARRRFKKFISDCRRVVKWNLKDIDIYFNEADIIQKMVIKRVPNAQLFFVSGFIWTLHACIYGS